MEKNLETIIATKIIQKEILNQLYKKDMIDLLSLNKITKKLNEDIIKLENIQEKNKEIKNIIVDIPI